MRSFFSVQVAFFALAFLSPAQSLAGSLSCEQALKTPSVEAIYLELLENPDFSELVNYLGYRGHKTEETEVEIGYAWSGRTVISYWNQPVRFEKSKVIVNEGFPVGELGADRVRYEIVAQLLLHIYTKRILIIRQARWIEIQKVALRLHYLVQVPLFASNPDYFALNTPGPTPNQEQRRSLGFLFWNLSVFGYRVAFPYLPPYTAINPMRYLKTSQEALKAYRSMGIEEYEKWVDQQLNHYIKLVRVHQAGALARPFSMALAFTAAIWSYSTIVEQAEKSMILARPAFESVFTAGREAFPEGLTLDVVQADTIAQGRLDKFVLVYRRKLIIESDLQRYADYTSELPGLQGVLDRLTPLLLEAGWQDRLTHARLQVEEEVRRTNSDQQ